MPKSPPSHNLALGVYRARMREPNGQEDKTRNKEETRKERQFSSRTPIKSYPKHGYRFGTRIMGSQNGICFTIGAR